LPKTLKKNKWIENRPFSFFNQTFLYFHDKRWFKSFPGWYQSSIYSFRTLNWIMTRHWLIIKYITLTFCIWEWVIFVSLSFQEIQINWFENLLWIFLIVGLCEYKRRAWTVCGQTIRTPSRNRIQGNQLDITLVLTYIFLNRSNWFLNWAFRFKM
jgi:hypothetical protein